MNFISSEFFLFCITVLILYRLAPDKWKAPLILLANAVFYGRLGWKSAVILAGEAGITYGIAQMTEKSTRRKKGWLIFGLAATLGTLAAFKYTNLAASWGSCAGISFFSFSLSAYLIDVYRQKIRAERNLLYFGAFAAFFPSVISGPINRADALLPQLKNPRGMSAIQFRQGFWRFLAGTAKKLIPVALLGKFVDTVYAAPESYGSGMWIVTAVLYAIQIYVDFSAYTDMALGIAGMLGFELQENFQAPYLSRTVADFWRKWHISLTSWLRDYLYFPLGGSRKGKLRQYLNILIVFAVSGIWHGTGWTFLIWGVLNGLYQCIGRWTLSERKKLHRKLGLREDGWLLAFWQGLCTFLLVTAAWIAFRAESLEQMVFIGKRILLIFRDGAGGFPEILNLRESMVLILSVLLILLEDIRISRGKRRFASIQHPAVFPILCAVLVCLILFLGQYGLGFQAQDFIYFKF